MNYIELIKKNIGSHYVKTIKARLISQGVVNAKGLSYSTDYIQKIACGVYENQDIEYELMYLIRQGKRKKQKKELLQLKLKDAANLIKTN